MNGRWNAELEVSPLFLDGDGRLVFLECGKLFVEHARGTSAKGRGGQCLAETEIILLFDAVAQPLQDFADLRPGIFAPVPVDDFGRTRVELGEEFRDRDAQRLSPDGLDATADLGRVRQREIEDRVRRADPVYLFQQAATG